MQTMHKINWKTTALTVLAAIFTTGCASTTNISAVGIERSQLMIIPAKELNERSAKEFAALNRAADQSKLLNKDKALNQRVSNIVYGLTGYVGDFRKDAQDWLWEVSIFNSNQINAFCAPGGKIGVFTGLIDRLKLNDHELAAVIGHEIAHALREHSREKASYAVVNGLVTTTAGAALGISPQLLSQGTSVLVTLPHSRAMEIEADIIGLELMAKAGYDPRQASSVWKKMQQHSEGEPTHAMFSTHPHSDQRIKTLESYVPKVLHFYESHPGKVQ